MLMPMLSAVAGFLVVRWARRKWPNDWIGVLVSVVCIVTIIWFVSIAVVASSFCPGESATVRCD